MPHLTTSKILIAQYVVIYTSYDLKSALIKKLNYANTLV